jgi:uncharacterized protein (TIRG00374 family)
MVFVGHGLPTEENVARGLHQLLTANDTLIVLLYGAGFAMCVLAVGGSVSLGEAIFINVTVSLFAGLMPVPGGIGVSEAGMTAGLTAIGVDSDVAVSAVLVYRLISYYLPPLWGYVSLRWLTKHDYL